MNKFKVGDIVKHDYSSEQQGTVTEIRDDKYSVFVKWDSAPERNDWFKPEVLVIVRGSGNVMTLKDLNKDK